MSFDKFLTKVFGSSNQRFLKSIQQLVERINSLEPSIKALSDDELRGRTASFNRTELSIFYVSKSLRECSIPHPRQWERLCSPHPGCPIYAVIPNRNG